MATAWNIYSVLFHVNSTGIFKKIVNVAAKGIKAESVIAYDQIKQKQIPLEDEGGSAEGQPNNRAASDTFNEILEEEYDFSSNPDADDSFSAPSPYDVYRSFTGGRK